MKTLSIDHLVLTVSDIDATVEFYERVLGMRKIIFSGNRVALKFGSQKINLHLSGLELKPNAKIATVGSADLCFLMDGDMSDIKRHLLAQEVAVEEGPVYRTGATSLIESVYIRDPNGNLLELSVIKKDLPEANIN